MIKDREEEFLLLRILPEQVSDKWDKFAPLIEKSLPPTVTQRRQRMANVLRAVLMEDLVVWLYIDKNGNEKYVASTLVRTDEVSLVKTLYLYSFTALGQLNPKEIEAGLEKLKTYAEGNDCTSIATYVRDPSIGEFLKNRGYSTEFTFAQKMI